MNTFKVTATFYIIMCRTFNKSFLPTVKLLLTLKKVFLDVVSNPQSLGVKLVIRLGIKIVVVNQ